MIILLLLSFDLVLDRIAAGHWHHGVILTKTYYTRARVNAMDGAIL